MTQDTRQKVRTLDGFTLLELMVSSSILVMVGLAILTTFASGFHVFERVQTYGGEQADVLLSLEEMQRDLSNAFPLSTIGFKGEAQRTAFPSIIETTQMNESGKEIAVSSLGQAVYYLEGTEEKALMRAENNYSLAVKGDETEVTGESRLASVKDLQFRYYFYDVENEQYDWKDSWAEEDGFPSAVEVALTYEDQGQDIQMIRTVLVPAKRVVDELIGPDDKGDEEGEEGEEGDGDGEDEEGQDV